MFNPDLHFTAGTFWALTPKGNSFYARQPITRSFKDIYKEAVEEGLRVSFETAAVRNKFTAIRAL